MDFHGAFEELAFLLTTRTLSDTVTASDVPHIVHNFAQRGIARAARLYNARQTHARVSPALLSMISSHLPMDDRLSVAHVCHRWREVCMADGTLWADIDTSLPMTFVRWQLQQSGSAPLCITADLVDARGYAVDDARSDMVATNMDRVQDLDILAESDVISRVLLRPASRLQRLTIAGAIPSRGEEPGPLKRKLFTGGVRWPILRELYVSRALLLHDANLVQVLAMCPNLEYLKCHVPEEGAVLKSSITTYLPRLRFVSFRGKTFQLAKVLPHLRAVREVEAKAVPQRIPLFSAASSLLPKLIARDEIDPVVAALIGFPEVRLRLERSFRTCHVACRQDVLWLLEQDQFFGSITSLILVADIPKKPLPAAPVLRTLILLHARDKRNTHRTLIFQDWQNYKFAWRTPALQTVCFGWLPETRRNDRHLVSISRRWLVTLPVLQDVFTFSADRRLPSLIIQNVELVDGEVNGEVVLKDLVEKVDVVQDLNWDPWATIVPSTL